MDNPDLTAGNHYVMLGGELLHHTQASIALEDRGFRFGDGIFTTITIIEKIPHLWELHLARLQAGNALLQLRCDFNTLLAELQQVILANHVTDGIARIIVTRGVGSMGYLPTYASPPTILIECNPHPPFLVTQYRHPHMLPAPLTLHTSTWRRPPPNVLPNTTKLLQVNPVLAKLEAQAAGSDEALMLDGCGYVSEAASGNIVWLDHTGNLHTPPLSTGCLNGVMRTHLMQHFTILETCVTLNELLTMPAVFFCNATTGVRSISVLDGHHFPQDSIWLAACQKYLHAQIAQEINTASTHFNCNYTPPSLT